MRSSNIKICKCLVSNQTIMNNFLPLEVVGRGSETQRGKSDWPQQSPNKNIIKDDLTQKRWQLQVVTYSCLQQIEHVKKAEGVYACHLIAGNHRYALVCFALYTAELCVSIFFSCKAVIVDANYSFKLPKMFLFNHFTNSRFYSVLLVV